MSRVYGADVLMQLLVCYAFILILDDVVKIIWGPEFLSMGMPAAFRLLPLFIAGRRRAAVLPVPDRRRDRRRRWCCGSSSRARRIGKMVRAAARQSRMVSALGINYHLIYGGVFALGSVLAGPRRRARGARAFADARHGLLDPDRILHRHRDRRHGLDRRRLVGALLIGFTRSFGSIGFPLFTEGLMFLFMALVLIFKPSGLFGKEAA